MYESFSISHVTVALDAKIMIGLFGTMRANDPSAGSPTETLLRLLLPLNDKVYSTSRIKEHCCKSTQSEVFTGSFNR